MMTRVKADSLLQLVLALKNSDFNPSVVNSESLVDIVIGVGESAIRKPSVGLNKST